MCNFPGLASLPLLRPSGKCRKSISNKIIKAQTPGNELRHGGEETGGARRLGRPSTVWIGIICPTISDQFSEAFYREMSDEAD